MRKDVTMPTWKIRVILPDDPSSHDALHSALAAHPPSSLRLESRGPGTAEATGDVVVELHEDEPLGDLLHALHEISPQVFISRSPHESAVPAPVTRGLGQALSWRRLPASSN
jgi:hypothetical protein